MYQSWKKENLMLLHGRESTARKTADAINPGAAFAMYLAELTPFLLARAMSLTGKRELAEDLVQETMANAWQARQSFTPGTNLKAWLCKILRNEFYSHQRRAWRQAPWCTMFEETIPSPPGQQLSALDLCEAACAMNSLPDAQCEALILVGVCGFSYEETASLLGGTIGTVKSRVARARLSLLNILQSRRQRRAKLHPASCRGFDEWLVHLDQLRISACRMLESGTANDFDKLAKVPKIPLRPAADPRQTFARATAIDKTALDDDAYEALGSPAAPSGARESRRGDLIPEIRPLPALAAAG
jgi:RNA polymerase sigma-70 factor (ECF subfamily)